MLACPEWQARSGGWAYANAVQGHAGLEYNRMYIEFWPALMATRPGSACTGGQCGLAVPVLAGNAACPGRCCTAEQAAAAREAKLSAAGLTMTVFEEGL